MSASEANAGNAPTFAAHTGRKACLGRSPRAPSPPSEILTRPGGPCLGKSQRGRGILGTSPDTVPLVDSDDPATDGPGLEYVTDDDGIERLRAALWSDGNGFGPLRFDANGRLTMGLGFGLERVAEGAAVDTDALAGDGLEADGPTGKLKAKLSDQLVFDNGAIAHDNHGQAAQAVDYKDHDGVNMQMLFDAKGHFVGIQAPPP